MRALARLGRLVGRSRALVCALGLFLGVVPLARAHRPTEATADFRWLHGRLEARVVLPLAMATRLLDEPEVVALRADNFPAHRAKLAARAAGLFALQADARELRPAEVIAELNAEGEVLATLLFAPSPPAALAFEAGFLRGLSNDSFCLLRVWHDADDLLVRQVLVSSSPRASAPAPAPAAPAVAP